jgi:hypothetical protein
MASYTEPRTATQHPKGKTGVAKRLTGHSDEKEVLAKLIYQGDFGSARVDELIFKFLQLEPKNQVLVRCYLDQLFPKQRWHYSHSTSIDALGTRFGQLNAKEQECILGTINPLLASQAQKTRSVANKNEGMRSIIGGDPAKNRVKGEINVRPRLSGVAVVS